MMDLDGSLTYRFLASIFGDFIYISLQCHFSSKVCEGKSHNRCGVFLKHVYEYG